MNKILEQVNNYFNTHLKEEIKKDWDSLEKYSNVGVTVEDFLNLQKHFIASEFSSQIQEEYSQWIQSIPDQLGYNVKDGNKIFCSLQNRFLERLSKTYFPLIGIKENVLLTQLKEYYDAKEY